MLDRELVERRLAHTRQLRDEYAGHVFRFEGAIIALEELLAAADQPETVETDEGPALDLTPFVEEIVPVSHE